MKRHSALFFSLYLAATGLAIGLQATPAQAITTWDWSFTTNLSDQSGSGTFTTADVVPTAGTTYDIIGISGTYNRGGTAYPISGPSSFFMADNKFQWDGTSSSPMLASPSGISFGAGTNNVNMYALVATGQFGAIYDTYSSFTTENGRISSSSLQPHQNPVPGPLPLFGAAAAYSWSRRLRRRIAEKV